MLYVDTSIIVKLYIREDHSREIANWLQINNEAIPLAGLHELEFYNAINLKQFRNEITFDEARLIMSRFNEHEVKGVFFRPQLYWPDIFKYAIELSKNYSRRTGSRSLDILHVASAFAMNCDRFLTFDDRQAKLASLTGLKIETVTNS